MVELKRFEESRFIAGPVVGIGQHGRPCGVKEGWCLSQWKHGVTGLVMTNIRVKSCEIKKFGQFGGII